MFFYIVLFSHSPLMHWNLSGFLIAVKSFDRYLTCASVLSIFELKMYVSECCLRKRFPKIRMSLACLQLIQRLRRSAIVFKFLLISFNSLFNSSILTDSQPEICLTLERFFRMKLMMALPQFLGMFLVSLRSLC